MQNKKQWQKRVDLTQYIFSCLMQECSESEIIEQANKYDFDANQLKVIEYFAANKDDMAGLFSSNLAMNWSWDRIAVLQQSILFVAYSEVKALSQPKAIAIDQALVTAKKYGQENAVKFLNAILDKVL